MLLKQKLKGIDDQARDVEYNYELTNEKIELQENYIDEIKRNKDKLIAEKTTLVDGNEEEIFKMKLDIDFHQQNNKELLYQIKDSDDVDEKQNKLKDIRSTLVEKRNNNSRMVEFFEKEDDCPTCEQHIDEKFKKDMISTKQKEVDKFASALTELEQTLDEIFSRKGDINAIADKIRENEVYLAKENSSITQLEKFNATLESEIEQLQSSDVVKSDFDKLEELKGQLVGIKEEKGKLKEEVIYCEAIRNMLQDTGIKTKIIKQYLPIMNKLINTYLTSMEFYVNFTLNESFEETIKSRYRDEFTYDSFSEGEKMRIDLALLFTWRAIAKMKNSTNTNLLMLDEIFDSSLDSTGTDEFLKILNTLGDENVFVISHKQDVLVDKFRSTIKFEKVKNFSHVVE